MGLLAALRRRHRHWVAVVGSRESLLDACCRISGEATGLGGPSLAKKGGSGFGSPSAQKMERPQGMGAAAWC
jgi:hypothetical protein